MVENVLYPAYFDASLSRSDGRRVPVDLAVEDPEVDEVAKAVQQVGYDVVVERDRHYSRESHRERGRVLVKNPEGDSKNDIVQAAAAYVSALRE
jgi:signal recognition particle subunit SRP19